MTRHNLPSRTSAIALGVMTALGTGQASAGSDNQFYAGINVAFGGERSYTPLLQLGFRQASVDPDGDADGWDASLMLGLAGVRNVRLAGHTGSRCTQGEASVGFDFAKNSALLGLGVQSNRFKGGIDWAAQAGDFTPYLGVNTIDCYDRERVAPHNSDNGYGGYGGYGGGLIPENPENPV